MSVTSHLTSRSSRLTIGTIGLGQCSSVWLEQEHRKVHFTCCFLPFFKETKNIKVP